MRMQRSPLDQAIEDATKSIKMQSTHYAQMIRCNDRKDDYFGLRPAHNQPGVRPGYLRGTPRGQGACARFRSTVEQAQLFGCIPAVSIPTNRVVISTRGRNCRYPQHSFQRCIKSRKDVQLTASSIYLRVDKELRRDCSPLSIAAIAAAPQSKFGQVELWMAQVQQLTSGTNVPSSNL